MILITEKEQVNSGCHTSVRVSDEKVCSVKNNKHSHICLVKDFLWSHVTQKGSLGGHWPNISISAGTKVWVCFMSPYLVNLVKSDLDDKKMLFTMNWIDYLWCLDHYAQEQLGNIIFFLVAVLKEDFFSLQANHQCTVLYYARKLTERQN